MEYLSADPSSSAEPTRSALIVWVPEADPVVGAHRARYDPSAALGVPAHVTVLVPFLDPGAVTGSVLARLTALLGDTEPFTCRFRSTAWFTDEVMWLAPDPAEPFRVLTHRVSEEFGLMPYGGVFDEVTPHLTVGQRSGGAGATLRELREAEADVRRALPLTTYADRLLLVAGDEGPSSWRVLAELPFGPTRAR